MGSIQEHLCKLPPSPPEIARTWLIALDASKDVTRSLLKTGAWESFSRSLRLEVQFIRQSCQAKLREDPFLDERSYRQVMLASKRPCCGSRLTTWYSMPMRLRSGLCKRNFGGVDKPKTCTLPRPHF